MPVRGEEVAGSIDGQVRESVEKMVAEIRSSVEDVRVAVDQQLRAALQSIQADVNSINFLPQIRKAVGDLEDTLAADRPVAAATSGDGVRRVKSAIQSIEEGKSQVDVLNSLLEQSLGFGSRAALLILRVETFSGWKGLGFTAHGGSDDMVKRFNAAPGLIPELDRVLRNEEVVEWDGANLATRLGVNGSERAVLIPMVIKDKVAAAVYVDAVGPDVQKFDADALELLVFTTGLLVDTLAIRKKIPSPSLRASGAAAQLPMKAPATPPPALEPEAPAATDETRIGGLRPNLPDIEPEPAPAPRRTDAGTVAISAAQIREMMAPQTPTFNMPAADEFTGPAAGTVRVPIPAAPPVEPPARPPAASDDRPSTQYIPPTNIARGASSGAQNEDSKKHDEARRFARLLVSEIKLYNETKVEQGRRNNDLYERLKDDIDRSRQMYDERIADEVRKASNYFYDELVRILADGKAGALGL